MSSPSPRRRRRKPQSPVEEGSQAPRKRKKRSGSQKKQTVNDVVLIKTILAVGVVFAVIGSIFLIEWHEIGAALGIPKSPQQLLKRMQYYQNKQIDLIVSIKDREQAKAAIPQLKEIAKELAIISIEYDEWDKTEDWEKHGAASFEEARQVILEIKEKRMQYESRLREEINRLKRESGLGHYVSNIVDNARFVGIRYGKEFKLNKVKEGAHADGYSPVTVGTKLTVGMQIQGIGTFVEWRDCVVKDVYQDGTVRVNFLIGIHSGLFDEKMDRDRLRIPDVVTLTNTLSSGTVRRIEGAAERSGGTGRRNEFPPAKRPRTGREF